MQVSDMFESVFKKFLENIDASQYDPIELNWIFGNTIAMEMSRIYLDQACERHGI